MPSIADTVAQVVAAGVPVLFLDTCSILDVIRAPLPERKLAGCVQAATELDRGRNSDTAIVAPGCRFVRSGRMDQEHPASNCGTESATQSHG